MSSFPLVVDLSTLTSTNGFIIQGDTISDRAGYSVSGAGDVNGDGIDDIIVGAIRAVNGRFPTGEAYLIYGHLDLGTFDFLTTFVEPNERAAALATIKGHLNNGPPSVAWQEGGATNVATIDAGTGNVVIETLDNGGLPIATSTVTFDGTTGNRISKVTVFDDGSIVTRDYGDGTTDMLLTQTTTGIVGAQDTSPITFDSAGRWDSLEITYDAGGSTRYDYDDAGRVDTLTQTQANGVVSTSQHQRPVVVDHDELRPDRRIQSDLSRVRQRLRHRAGLG